MKTPKMKSAVKKPGAAQPGAKMPKRTQAVRLLPSVITILALCAGLSAVKFALDGTTRYLARDDRRSCRPRFTRRPHRATARRHQQDRRRTRLTGRLHLLRRRPGPGPVRDLAGRHQHRLDHRVDLRGQHRVATRTFHTLCSTNDDVPAYAREYFVGVPAPAGALIALTPLAATAQWGDGWWSSHFVVIVWTLFSAALIVSRFPTLAMKSVSVPPHMAAGLLVLVTLAAAALITYPYILLIVLIAIYLVHIPFAVHSKRWVAARPENLGHQAFRTPRDPTPTQRRWPAARPLVSDCGDPASPRRTLER